MSGEKPYRFEPRYSEEEYAEITQTQTTEDKRMESLHGRSNNVAWCKCGECVIMKSDTESSCCTESSIINTVRQDSHCIVYHGAFDSVVLNLHTLTTARQNLLYHAKSTEQKKQLENINNKLWRHIAYRQFFFWINAWQKIGQHRRFVLPSCVVKSIQGEYPEANGVYVGFKTAAGVVEEYFE
jgi:hypothetical protein